MKNHFNVNMKSWVVVDVSESICSFEATTQVGNTYQDLMGFGELWVISNIEDKKIHLVSISNQWRPVIVTDYNEDFLYRFSRYLVSENSKSDKGE